MRTARSLQPVWRRVQGGLKNTSRVNKAEYISRAGNKESQRRTHLLRIPCFWRAFWKGLLEQSIAKDTLNRRRRCPRMKRRRFPRRSHWRFGAALAGWEEEVDDHLILWRNKTTPETQLGPNRDTPATANVKRFFMGYKESARSKLEAMMFRWVIKRQ